MTVNRSLHVEVINALEILKSFLPVYSPKEKNYTLGLRLQSGEGEAKFATS